MAHKVDVTDTRKQRGEEPKRPYSGKFVVRVEPKIHRLISTMAESSGMSLNAWINDRLANNLVAELVPEPASPKQTRAKQRHRKKAS